MHLYHLVVDAGEACYLPILTEDWRASGPCVLLACLCNKEEETLDHLFFECDVAEEVWMKVTKWCGFQRQAMKWSMGKEWLLSQCKTNSGVQRIYKCMLTILVY